MLVLNMAMDESFRNSYPVFFYIRLNYQVE